MQSAKSGTLKSSPPTARRTTSAMIEPTVQTAMAQNMATPNFALLVDRHARQRVVAMEVLEEPCTNTRSKLLTKKLWRLSALEELAQS